MRTSRVLRSGLRPQSVSHESHEARYGTISGLCIENKNNVFSY